MQAYLKYITIPLLPSHHWAAAIKTRSMHVSMFTAVNGRSSIGYCCSGIRKFPSYKTWERTGPLFQCQTKWTDRELSVWKQPRGPESVSLKLALMKKWWLMEHADHRGIIVDAPNCFAEKVGNWQHSQLGEIVLFLDRNRVCYNYLLEQTAR